MPVDTKRLPVPQDSRPYLTAKSAAPPVNKDGQRTDGRPPGEIRQIFTALGTISKARGSCYMEVGSTKVICAVYGPREIERRDRFSTTGLLSCTFKFATFSQRRERRQHQSDSEERETSQIIREALEPAVILERFPKARLDIFITVLEDGGGALAAAISCASLAVSHAGIEMYDLVTASSLRYIDGISLLNPTDEEEHYVKASDSSADDCCITVAYLPNLRQISSIVTSGTQSLATNQKNINTCIEACIKISKVLQNSLTSDSDQSQPVKN